MRFLFAGALSQRKGLADLFAAMKLVRSPGAELVVMGSPILPMHFYRNQFAGFTHEPPRPHEAVLRLMSSCDVLVLPSILEGRALVQQEAMACGLPLIATRNAGGEDLIVEGETGFLVEPPTPEMLAEKLDSLLREPEQLNAAVDRAYQIWKENFTLERYRRVHRRRLLGHYLQISDIASGRPVTWTTGTRC